MILDYKDFIKKGGQALKDPDYLKISHVPSVLLPKPNMAGMLDIRGAYNKQGP